MTPYSIETKKVRGPVSSSAGSARSNNSTESYLFFYHYLPRSQGPGLSTTSENCQGPPSLLVTVVNEVSRNFKDFLSS